jgi:hypothetical protein
MYNKYCQVIVLLTSRISHDKVSLYEKTPY